MDSFRGKKKLFSIKTLKITLMKKTLWLLCHVWWTKQYYCFVKQTGMCSCKRRFNILMSFVSDRKEVEMMLKENVKAFRENEQMLFWPTFEEVVVKLLTSKNKSRKLLRNLWVQESLSGNKDFRSPFRKFLYLVSEGIEGEEYFHKLTNQPQMQEHRKEAKILSPNSKLIIPKLLSPVFV